jgi:hypothetical protein
VIRDDETLARLVDRVAALPDAPDPARCEWFYADLRALAGEAIGDAVARELDDHTAERQEQAFNAGHDAGYQRGLDDARTRPHNDQRTTDNAGEGRVQRRDAGRRAARRAVAAHRHTTTEQPQRPADATVIRLDDRARQPAHRGGPDVDPGRGGGRGGIA